MNTQNWREKFSEKFERKTYDTYQGWTFSDLEEIESFIADTLRSELGGLVEEVEKSKWDEVTMLLEGMPLLYIQGRNQIVYQVASFIRERIEKI